MVAPEFGFEMMNIMGKRIVTEKQRCKIPKLTLNEGAEFDIDVNGPDAGRIENLSF